MDTQDTGYARTRVLRITVVTPRCRDGIKYRLTERNPEIYLTTTYR
jgi:hypothetical protein